MAGRRGERTGGSLPAAERLKAWVRAGGRCEICNRYLLEGDLAGREHTFGELAHIVGQQETAGSPRGLDDLVGTDRDTADNVMLVCDDEHDELDKLGSRDAFSVETLRAMKRRHEERIRHVTGFAEDRRTVVVRMVGLLHGDAVEVGRDATAGAVIRDAGRFPRFPLAFREQIEIDLRHVPGEAAADPRYYEIATATIDEILDHKLRDGIAKEEVSHLSVFAFARLPLLVYLGSKLDDNVPTDIYQRHRATESWEWPDAEAEAAFDLAVPAATAEAGVLVMNISGSIQQNELPTELSGLPRFGMSLSDATPSPDALRGPKALTLFTGACRQLLAEIEATHKQLKVLHVFAAIPLSAGVALGRVLDPAVHPSALIYDRTNAGYHPVLRVGAR